MSFRTWLQNLRSTLAPSRCQRNHGRQSSLRAARHRPSLDILEDRLTPSFSAPTSYPLEFGAAVVLSADFNHDDRLDLATVYQHVNVFLGDGQGGFGAPSQFGLEDSSWTGVTADFNNDGHPDLATLNNDRSLSVWRGNGDGTFQPAVKTTLAPWSMMHSMAAADFNGDGNMDLVYSAEENYQTEWGSVEVLLGDGQGGFAARHLYQLQAKNPYGLAVADLNADGRPDVVTTNFDYYDGFVSVLLGNGDGTLSYDVNSSNFAASLYPAAVAVGDFTSDGVPDLVITGFAEGGTAVLPGLGDGTFPAQIGVPGSHASDSLAAADFNGDGRLDVLTLGEGSDDYGPASLFLGHGNGFFEGPQDVDIGGWYPGSPDAGDYNGDGRPDLAVGVGFTFGNVSVSVLLNNADWAPLPPSLRIGNCTVTEGNTGTSSATFTVTLSVASAETITVDYATGDGSATAGSDYQAVSGTLTFAPGETSKTITVPVIDDRLVEPTEYFYVALTGATNAVIADDAGAGIILDDEPRISISDVTKAEGKKGQTTLFTFTVTLLAAYDQPVTVSYQTVNGTAKSGEDYLAQSGTLTFLPVETTKTITIEVKGDIKKEANETFYLDLFGLSSNALLIDGRGVGTIVNDD